MQPIYCSFWGYFGMSPQQTQTVQVSDYAKLISLLEDPTKRVTTTYLVNENVMVVEYAAADGYEKVNPKLSAVIACFTTAHGKNAVFCLHNPSTSPLQPDSNYTANSFNWETVFSILIPILWST